MRQGRLDRQEDRADVDGQKPVIFGQREVLDRGMMRGGRPQLVELLHRPRLAQLHDLVRDMTAHVRGRVQALLVHGGDLGVVAGHRPRRLLIRTHPERITTRDHQQVGELLQHLRGRIIRASHDPTLRAQLPTG
jgi:hypothetical protein